MSSAPVGGYYPGTLSVVTDPPPIVPYKGDAWTATKFHIRVGDENASTGDPSGTSIKVTLRRNGSDEAGSEAEIAIAGYDDTTTGLSISVADGDYFSIDITQVGSGDAGTDLTWLVAP